MNAALVAGHYCCDVVLHALLEHLRGHIFTILIIRKPLRKLRVPYEAVTDDEHVVCFTEFHELVSKLEIPYIFFRVNLHALHAVLRHDGIEVLLHDLDSCGVPTSDLGLVKRRSDVELALESVLYALRGLWCACGCHQGRCSKCQKSFHMFNCLILLRFPC